MNLDNNVIVEAVPNFAEGRSREVVERIAAAIQAPGVHLLDYSRDADHNRSVITIAGAPKAVLEGLFRAVAEASTQIDLFQHKGVHPRLGAADVVPLIPIAGITLAECAALAHQLGQRIGEELQLPVYLYEAAATRPERRNLADVRRGDFELLCQEITQPHRQPDFGPAQIGPAGAVVVGAREFLVAFNLFLQTNDVAIAKAISKQIRQSSGGLSAVKAIGLLVDGQAQVSMNLVDFRQTGLGSVVDEVARLAIEHGTQIDRGELIGLLPQQALLDVAAHYLQLPSLQSRQIVEQALLV